MECPKCKKGELKIVDEENYLNKKKYVLLECEKCNYTVIRPDKEK